VKGYRIVGLFSGILSLFVPALIALEPMQIVLEGRVLYTNDQPIPFVAVSNSLDTTVTHTDTNGHYLLTLGVLNDATNFPFHLFLAKPAYRPAAILVSNSPLFRVDHMTLLGQTNNDFTNRYFIPTVNYSGKNNNRACDLEPGEQGPGDKSVWYSYTAPADGTIRVIGQSLWMRPVFSFFTGSELASLQMRAPTLVSNYVEARTYIAADVTMHGGESLQIRIGALPHQVGLGGDFSWSLNFASNYPLYAIPSGKLAGQIAISPPPNAPGNRYQPGTLVELNASTNFGYSFAGWSGDIVSTNPHITIPMDAMKLVTANFHLVNDNFADAIVLDAPFFGAARAVNAYGSKEPGEPDHCGAFGGNSVWWRWTAPVNMGVELQFEFVGFTALIAVYTGDAVSNLTLVANNQNVRNKRVVRFDAVGGTTYSIAVDGFRGDQSFDFSFYMIGVQEARYWLAWETEGNGTIWLDPPPDGAGEYAAGTSVSVWPISIGMSRFDFWTGYPSAQSVPLGTNVPLVVTMNRDQRIRGTFAAIDAPPSRSRRPRHRPPNDNFANRTVLFQVPTYVFASNRRATPEAGEPSHAGGHPRRSLWWTWTAQSDSAVELRFQWALFDAAIAVYTGDTLTNLTPIASTRVGPFQDTRTVLEFPANVGTSYHIAVDQFSRKTNDAPEFSFVLWPK
jgi:hypothetical protein